MTGGLVLPLDVIEEIITQAWNLHLSPDERILLMTSLPLVCKDILDIYLRISSTHVHIPCPAYVEEFLQILREGAPRYPVQKHRDYAKVLCNTIELEIVQDTQTHISHNNTEPPMGAALSDLLYDLRLFGDLPNFRTLIIRYNNTDMNDIFDWVRFIDFPKTVHRLVLGFTQTEDVTPEAQATSRHPSYHSLDNPLWLLPSLLHLQVSGGSDELVTRLASAAPNLLTKRHVTKS